MAMAKKCRLESEVGFLISIKNIQVAYTYFVKCKRTILEQIPYTHIKVQKEKVLSSLVHVLHKT